MMIKKIYILLLLIGSVYSESKVFASDAESEIVLAEQYQIVLNGLLLELIEMMIMVKIQVQYTSTKRMVMVN